MLTKTLTPKQKQVLDFLKRWMGDQPYPPTVREIQKGLDISSTATVQWLLNKLQEKGYIRRNCGRSRSIEILDFQRFDRAVSIPVIGRVRAGEPLLATEDIEGTITLDAELVSNPDECFMLKVEGDSMSGAGIMAGDYVVVHQQQTADNGDIVVALIDDEVTVKRCYREESLIRLQPENPDYEPICTTEALIVGKVVGVYRKI